MSIDFPRKSGIFGTDTAETEEWCGFDERHPEGTFNQQVSGSSPDALTKDKPVLGTKFRAEKVAERTVLQPR
jgi:hypothetical protein